MENKKEDIVNRLLDIRTTHADAKEAAELIIQLRKKIEELCIELNNKR